MSAQVNLRMTADERERIKAAAKAAGMTLSEYARRTLLADARALTGTTGDSMPAMVKRLHDRIMGKDSPNGGTEGEAAVQTLIAQGMQESVARQRVARAEKARPGADAGELVIEAYRERAE